MQTSVKKLAALFAFLVSLFGMFAVLLTYKTGAIPFLNPSADAERQAYLDQHNREKTVEGSIVDRSGTPITQATEPGEPATVISTAFSDIVGYNSDVYAQYGLRREFYSALFNGGTDGVGQTLHLTIDAALQQFCYDQLGANEGAVLVIDSCTGEILAMASRSYPDLEYDANRVDEVVSDSGEDVSCMMNLYQQRDSFFLNRATMAGDPPGSTMKIVTALCMLQNGMEDFVYDDSTGQFHVGGNTISNFNNAVYGPDLDLQTALNVSSNTYFAAAACELGTERLEKTMKSLGIGEEIECDWTVLTSGYEFKNSSDYSEMAQVGFGQGRLSVSPMNVAMFMMPVLNEGKLMTPWLIGGISDEKDSFTNKPDVYSKPMSRSQARKLGDLLHGTALYYGFDEETYGRVYAKTGTAETSRGTNHIYYVCGLEKAGREERNLTVVASMNNTSSMSGSLGPIIKNIAAYLVQN